MPLKTGNRKTVIPLISALLLIMLSSCSREQLKSINVKRNFTGSLWVVRHNIATKGQIDELLKTAKLNGLFYDKICATGTSFRSPCYISPESLFSLF